MDWGVGHYEHTAAQLLPAARVVVECAAPAPGEHVVDVGCGTGNAALLAAARGANVTGVDPAPRLLEIAHERAAAQGLAATFLAGDAAAMPLADGAADVVLSVFGVIFALDAPAAAAEIARATAPGGRIVISAWIPGGAISAAARLARETIGRALGTPAGGRMGPFQWHDRDAVAGLLGPRGFEVQTSEHSLTFTAGSVGEYLDAEWDNHPLSVSGRAILEPRGEAQALRERTLALLDEANEDPAAFAVTSRYVVVTARQHP